MQIFDTGESYIHLSGCHDGSECESPECPDSVGYEELASRCNLGRTNCLNPMAKRYIGTTIQTVMVQLQFVVMGGCNLR